MKIGLSYDIKEQAIKAEGLPEDAFEEYDSPETIEALAAAISSHGHTVLKLGGGSAFLKSIQGANLDLVFNVAEGLGNHRSREAQVPSVLDAGHPLLRFRPPDNVHLFRKTTHQAIGGSLRFGHAALVRY
jgi:hypothetical protein